MDTKMEKKQLIGTVMGLYRGSRALRFLFNPLNVTFIILVILNLFICIEPHKLAYLDDSWTPRMRTDVGPSCGASNTPNRGSCFLGSYYRTDRYGHYYGLFINLYHSPLCEFVLQSNEHGIKSAKRNIPVEIIKTINRDIIDIYHFEIARFTSRTIL